MKFFPFQPIVRKPKTMTKLKIPKALQKELPYHMKPKFNTKEPKQQRIAVVRSEREEKVRAKFSVSMAFFLMYCVD